MFGKMMNNFYYGKSGKGDFTKEDLPTTRWQLFWQTLRVRFSGLIRLNLMYFVVWIPAVIVLIYFGSIAISALTGGMDPNAAASAGAEVAAAVETAPVSEETLSPDAINNLRQGLYNICFWGLLLLWPCIAITGPATAGVCYVTRNWARDEHAFIWSDFKDAVKENWKRSLIISTITGLIPFLVYIGWTFYGQMAAGQMLMMIPQVLILLLGIIWAISVTYMHPFNVSYDLGVKGQIRNGLLLGIARLPMSVGIRLLHCVPTALAVLIFLLTGNLLFLFLLVAYYLLIGFSLSRFISASYTNMVFDKYINARIEGAQVNKGLREEDDDADEGDETEEGQA